VPQVLQFLTFGLKEKMKSISALRDKKGTGLRPVSWD